MGAECWKAQVILGLGVSPGRSKYIGEEEHRHGHIGRTLCGAHEMLAETQIVGVIWLTEAKEAGVSPGGLSPPTLLTRDVGMAVGGMSSSSPARGIWVDGLPASLPMRRSCPFQFEVATQQHTRAVKSNPVLGWAALKPCVSSNLKA